MQELLGRQRTRGQRYAIEGEIARGGMGAILRAIDCDIRREVAIKYLLDQTDAGKKLRFIEEAQITGQLEHPNIPPVHELGIDAQKRLFFSMKMVKGRSLAHILDELREQPHTAAKEWPLGRLLTIFVNICHGLAYAHSCGVVHRDLKPANIMVGDFGEVYVMDWGLAKVVREGSIAAETPMALPVAAATDSVPTAVPVAGAASAQPSKVETSRAGDADLTQDGAILGTPVYMPPEQAAGKVAAIDQRSDVYSLGAILYEILTLQAPIDKEGGYLAVLLRVMQGEIVPPEQRSPQRAKAGKMPKELCAIALKAMAQDPKDRYPNVESLRKDLEWFQEGRSVSAKADSTREMLWKLLKRNRMASAFTAALALVLVWGSWTNWQARWTVEKAEAARIKQGKDSVPSLVRASKLLRNEGDFTGAMTQARLALSFDPEEADAHLLCGQLLIGEQDYAAATEELEACAKARPGDTAAKNLAELCRGMQPHDSGKLFRLADELYLQKTFALAARVTEQAVRLVHSRQTLLPQLQKRIEAAWPGNGRDLTITDEGLRFELNGNERTTDLSSLRGMPLTALRINYCTNLRDLSPLQGMKLSSLELIQCAQVKDLSPLKGMRLTALNLSGCVQVKDLSPLKDMPLNSLDIQDCGQVTDLTPLKDMKLQGIGLTAKNFTEGQMNMLRRMKTLQTINGFNAGDYWKKYDAGEFNK